MPIRSCSQASAYRASRRERRRGVPAGDGSGYRRDMADHQHITVERDGDVVRITMNRPERRNALSEPHLRELLDAFEEAGRSHATGIVLGGNGPAFSAGHDFADVAARDLAGVRELLRLCTQVMQTIHEVPQVVIARVHAIATAAGCQLVASCDLAVAAESARFATPGVDIGLFCTTPMVALTRNVAPKHAMEMLLTGEPIDAAEAQRIGLINRVVPDAELDAAAADLAATIASKSPAVLAIGKEAFRRQRNLPLVDAYGYASGVMAANLEEPDAAEGI